MAPFDDEAPFGFRYRAAHRAAGPRRLCAFPRAVKRKMSDHQPRARRPSRLATANHDASPGCRRPARNNPTWHRSDRSSLCPPTAAAWAQGARDLLAALGQLILQRPRSRNRRDAQTIRSLQLRTSARPPNGNLAGHSMVTPNVPAVPSMQSHPSKEPPMPAPNASYSITMRVHLDTDPRGIGRITTAVGEAAGTVTAVDVVESRADGLVVDLTCNTRDTDHAEQITKAVDRLEGVETHKVSDRTFLLHLGGKLEVTSKVPLRTRDDLSMAYTPGVARVCRAIASNPDDARKLTIKRNTVAVVTDGSAVLGLGNIGPAAAMPVMEGKAVLFKQFAGVDAWPVALATQDTDEIVRAVELIAPAYGGINLSDIRVVMSGAGAAGVAIVKILQAEGVNDVVVCDRTGILYPGRDRLDDSKRWVAEHTNEARLQGSLLDALAGADVFVGVSSADLLQPADLRAMNQDAIVFALANPDPEVDPAGARRYAAVVATGRSDEPNQINNVLAFPGVFRGALDAGAHAITEPMKVAAARAIAARVADEELRPEYIVPSVFDRNVAPAVARAVPEAVGLCPDPSVTGAPFYVMRYVDGIVPRDEATVAGAFDERQRATASMSLVEALVALHRVDPHAVGLGGLGRRDGYAGRQLRRWSRQSEQSRTRELPAIEEVGRRLAARVPPQGAATIVHGDYRLDNLVLSPAGEVLAVLDWELCTLGDPLADVGLLLVYWSEPGDEVLPLGSAPTAMPGFPPRQELAAAYARSSGRDLGDLEFYQALGYWKLAVILEGVYARSAAGAYGGGDDTYRGFAAVVARLAERALDATARAGR